PPPPPPRHAPPWSPKAKSHELRIAGMDERQRRSLLVFALRLFWRRLVQPFIVIRLVIGGEFEQREPRRLRRLRRLRARLRLLGQRLRCPKLACTLPRNHPLCL